MTVDQIIILFPKSESRTNGSFYRRAHNMIVRKYPKAVETFDLFVDFISVGYLAFNSLIELHGK